MDTEEEADPLDESIVEMSKSQREAVIGEPSCAVCGRFGAYVCADTEADVCSLECKACEAHVAAKLSDHQRQCTEGVRKATSYHRGQPQRGWSPSNL
jgi:hypothetical protein